MDIVPKNKPNKPDCPICHGTMYHSRPNTPLCPSFLSWCNNYQHQWKKQQRKSNPKLFAQQAQKRRQRYQLKHGKEAIAERGRANSLYRLYKITPAEYDTLLQEQNGRCASCGTTNSGRHRFAVDHDHATNFIRGLLCHQCNKGLGSLGDSIEGVQKALDYLKRYANKINVC